MGTLFLLASLPLCDCLKLLNSKTPTGDSAKVPRVRQSKMLLGFWIPEIKTALIMCTTRSGGKGELAEDFLGVLKYFEGKRGDGKNF